MIATIYLYSVLLFAFATVSAAFFFGTRVVFHLIATARANAQTPVTTVRARIVAKRADPTGVIDDPRSLVSYHITFETEGGHRSDFDLVGKKFLPLAVGDEGILSVQGTRFVGFERLEAKSDRVFS